VLSTLIVDEFVSDTPGVAIPRAEPQLVVRFGPSARGGVDVHAMGPRERAHRKLIRAGQRAVVALLRLGAHEAVLGVPASHIAGRVVALDELWGGAATRQLEERLARAREPLRAAAVVEAAIAERLAATDAQRAHTGLLLAAADKLESGKVSAVARELGVSARNLRRVFREAVGMSPKAYARLTRFHRALRTARHAAGLDWATIALDCGYYDQAHLISEFRVIAGVTPRTLLRELELGASRAAPFALSGQRAAR